MAQNQVLQYFLHPKFSCVLNKLRQASPTQFVGKVLGCDIMKGASRGEAFLGNI